LLGIGGGLFWWFDHHFYFSGLLKSKIAKNF